MAQLQEIRANYDRDTIMVYQAYNKQITLPAIAKQKFVAPFSFNRMTWIKPSYLWLMERSQWGLKSNQEYILAIHIKRSFWDKALSLGILTHPEKSIYGSGQQWEKLFNDAPVHIQWDPERSLRGAKLTHSSIQVGISRFLIEEYNNEAIVSIEDMTALTRKIYSLRQQGKTANAKQLLPNERLYPIDKQVGKNIGIS